MDSKHFFWHYCVVQVNKENPAKKVKKGFIFKIKYCFFSLACGGGWKLNFTGSDDVKVTHQYSVRWFFGSFHSYLG